MSAVLHQGDCLQVMRDLEAESFDACITDPPYHLSSVVKRFGDAKESDDTQTSARIRSRADGYARCAAGFMGQKWDGGNIAFRPETWAEVYRVLKPGAHLLAFGGTRNHHRMFCAIEDAGFEIRDTIMWVYGQGFPKSHNVSKGIDKKLGLAGSYGEPKSPAHAGWIDRGAMRGEDGHEGYQRPWMQDEEAVERNARVYVPGSPEAAEWVGWGTALKPAWEPICVARKPIAGTVAQNVLSHGTGGLNIDACRVGSEVLVGRWPANLAHDGSDEVIGAFPNTGPSVIGKPRGSANPGDGWGMTQTGAEYDDAGSAARYFYCAKASSKDRAGSKHPTVKPIKLLQWMVRLVTPKGGLIIDPFAGSGTLAIAAWLEEARCVLIEAESQYCDDIRQRLAAANDNDV